MWDLSVQQTDSLVVAHGFIASWHVGSSQFPSQMEPMSPALQGGFLTTGPPEKPLRVISYSSLYPSVCVRA